MLIRFYTLEDTEQLERDICERDTLVKIVDTGDGDYNPYEFSDAYYLDSAYPLAYGAV